jgi:hypothetical protein
VYGCLNVTIVITSVAFCGGLSANFKTEDFSVDGHRVTGQRPGGGGAAGSSLAGGRPMG